MSDELKPCPWCGKAPTLHYSDITEEWHVYCYHGDCMVRPYVFKLTKAEAIAAWNTRANDNLSAETVISDKRVDANDGNAAQGLRDFFGIWKSDELADDADSREQLEADALDYVVRTAKLCHGIGLRHELWQFNPEPLHMHIRQCLDRQAAITTHEVSDSYEHVAERQSDRIFELHNKLADALEQVDSLTAERDELQSIIDHMPKTEQECEACQDAHDRLMFNAKLHQDELREKLAEKQRTVEIQRDSFLKLEAENAELRKMLADAAEAI